MSALARCRHSTTMCALDNRERIQKDDPQARIVADGLECAGIPVHFKIDPLGVAKNPLEAGYLPVGQIDVVVGIRDKTGDHHYPNGVAHSARLEATRRCAACERQELHGTYPPNCCNRYVLSLLSPVAWLESVCPLVSSLKRCFVGVKKIGCGTSQFPPRIDRKMDVKGVCEMATQTITQPAAVGDTTTMKKNQKTAAQLLIRSLVQQNVKYIFGIPGGKIMPTFDVLRDEGPQLIVCRHEQNAAFMAAAIGRLTGRPGVCLVTSGPGTGNLVTGAATATTEGDPMVAIGGVVPLPDTLKQTHQSMDSVAIMKPVTKLSIAINAPDAAGEAVVNAFRAGMAPRPGAAFIAFPRDVQGATTEVSVPPSLPLPSLGAAPADLIRKAAEKISKAKSPVILLGMGASDPDATAAVRALLKRHAVPAVGTFQGAGAISRELLPLFFGRVGLFRNQPGDKMLATADVVLTIGYDPVEYDPSFWNVGKARAIIHISIVWPATSITTTNQSWSFVEQFRRLCVRLPPCWRSTLS